MLNTITGALRANKSVHDWQIRRTSTVQNELYIIGEQVESRRTASSEVAQVLLYHDHDGKRGSSSLTFAPGHLEDCAKRIEEAVYMASLAGNPPYELPGPHSQPDVQINDPALAQNPEGVIEKWREDLVAAVKDEPMVSLSAAEFFVYNQHTDFINSKGASYSYPSTRAYLELVLLSRDGGIDSENHHAVSVRRAEDLDIRAVVKERASFARDMLHVSMPKAYTGPVVISGRSLASLFRPFLSKADAGALYRGISDTKVGDELFPDGVKGDVLSISMDSTVPFGLSSAPVDVEGLPARRVDVIKDGRVNAITAGKRFADYLGIEPTGTGGTMVVSGGTAGQEELLAGPVVELVLFSSLSANPMTGAFVSEIRLGYEIDEQGNRKPIKGGSVTGNVFKAFADCRISRELVKAGGYHGPSAIRFAELTISGE